VRNKIFLNPFLARIRCQYDVPHLTDSHYAILHTDLTQLTNQVMQSMKTIRNIFLSTCLLSLFSIVTQVVPAIAYSTNRSSIVVEPSLDESATYPEVNSTLKGSLTESQYSRLFWRLTEFTKATGIRVAFPDSNGVENLTDSQLDSLLIEFTRFKPYAIALNLNRQTQKVYYIDIHQKSVRGRAGYNYGDKIVIYLEHLDLRILFHELLHSVDPFSATPSDTRKCMNIVFGDNLYSVSSDELLADNIFDEYIIKDYDVANDDLYSGILPKLRDGGDFGECFAEFGETQLYLSSPRNNEKRRKAFKKFVASLGINSYLYTTPQFVNLFESLLMEGENISPQKAEIFSRKFKTYWRSLKNEELDIFAAPNLDDEFLLIRSLGITMGNND
jgi:hypothetical protein